MIDFFQITGSSSFAVRAALEEGGIEYTVHNVHPKRRDETPGFAEANPLTRVPAIVDGDVSVYETAAILLYLVERFPGVGLGPAPGLPGRGDLFRWMVYLANTVHNIHYPILWPGFVGEDPAGHDGIRATGLAKFTATGDHLEAELTAREWCLAEGFSVADIYLYMLKGWEFYHEDGLRLGGPALDAHYARVGARPAIARTRELEDLDERLMRYHPEMRGGQPL